LAINVPFFLWNVAHRANGQHEESGSCLMTLFFFESKCGKDFNAEQCRVLNILVPKMFLIKLSSLKIFLKKTLLLRHFSFTQRGKKTIYFSHFEIRKPKYFWLI